MRQERFYTVVGMFVIGAMILVILGAVFFYNQHKEAKLETFVFFFPGSLEGLDTNSMVNYRGVKIGRVTRIEITEDRRSHKVDIPVYVQFFVQKSFGLSHSPVRTLIKEGYFAQIASPNFLTGLSHIELVKSDTESPATFKFFRGNPVFPTKHRINKRTTLDETLNAAKKTFEDISVFMQSQKLQEILRSTTAMTDSFSTLAKMLEREFPTGFTNFNQTMKQFSGVAASAANLADYLSRHPEALLRGKN